MRALHKENHLIERIGWLRAAVLGANDGLISTSSLIVGVAAATNASHEILVAGVAGLAGVASIAAIDDRIENAVEGAGEAAFSAATGIDPEAGILGVLGSWLGD